MKGIFNKTFQKSRLYKRWRYSSAYYALLKYTNRHYFQYLNQDFQFYLKTLPISCKLIFDVGANHGDKAMIFKQIAQQVVCVEPDESSFEALSIRYGKDPKVQLENMALGAKSGQQKFFVTADGSAYNTLSKKQKKQLDLMFNKNSNRQVVVSVSTLDYLIHKYGIPDFIKIDVEGYEHEVIQGLNHTIPIIAFEANLPAFLNETISILDNFCQKNKLVKFNLMDVETHNFVFPSRVPYESIISVLNLSKTITYDVFVYN
jgi:FkbM family methyltransferase